MKSKKNQIFNENFLKRIRTATKTNKQKFIKQGYFNIMFCCDWTIAKE
jgi:hypothetical protein